MPALSVLLKPSSSLCNMSCDYCFYCDESEKRARKSYGFMSEQTLKNVIRRTMLRAEGMISYAFQGGEPSLRGLDFFRQAVAFQKQYNKRHLTVQNAFQTNGLLIDGEWCRFFAEARFLVGLSVDGTPEIHDSLRHIRGHGGPSSDRVIRCAGQMDQYGVEYPHRGNPAARRRDRGSLFFLPEDGLELSAVYRLSRPAGRTPRPDPARPDAGSLRKIPDGPLFTVAGGP